MKTGLLISILVILQCGLAFGDIFECANQLGCMKAPGQQCCQRKGNLRQSGSTFVTTSLPGFCTSFGIQGSSCVVNTVLNDDGTYSVCPCDDGQTCVGTGNTDEVYGIMGMCE